MTTSAEWGVVTAMEPNKSPAMLALRTPLRLAALLTGLLVMTGTAAAQLPALPSTDDLPLSTDLDLDVDTPVGGVDASHQDGHAQACADAYASSDIVTRQIPAAPVPLPVPIPSAPPVEAGASQCVDADYGQAIDDAMEQTEQAKGQAGSALDEVKSFFDGLWSGLRGLF